MTPFRRRRLSGKVCDGGTPSPARGTRALPSDRQLQQFIKLLSGLKIHDALAQFLALIVADYIAAERVKFHRDFFFGHRIAWIGFGNINRVERGLPSWVVIVTRLG
jgi:hypothetical protein